jgi:hypothetical protein
MELCRWMMDRGASEWRLALYEGFHYDWRYISPHCPMWIRRPLCFIRIFGIKFVFHRHIIIPTRRVRWFNGRPWHFMLTIKHYCFMGYKKLWLTRKKKSYPVRGKPVSDPQALYSHKLIHISCKSLSLSWFNPSELTGNYMHHPL